MRITDGHKECEEIGNGELKYIGNLIINKMTKKILPLNSFPIIGNYDCIKREKVITYDILENEIDFVIEVDDITKEEIMLIRINGDIQSSHLTNLLKLIQ